ncbi:MAG: hypothetical protein HFE04_03525 [Bacilli bacterium]|nr:hypothetical protein [Bacilli bacterium]
MKLEEYNKKIEETWEKIKILESHGFTTKELKIELENIEIKPTKKIVGNLIYLISSSPKIYDLEEINSKIEDYLKYIEIIKQVNEIKEKENIDIEEEIQKLKAIIISLREVRHVITTNNLNDLKVLYCLILDYIKKEILKDKEMHSSILDLILEDKFDKGMIERVIDSEIDELRKNSYLNINEYQNFEEYLKKEKQNITTLASETIIKGIIACTDKEQLEENYLTRSQDTLKEIKAILEKMRDDRFWLQLYKESLTNSQKKLKKRKTSLKNRMPSFILSTSLAVSLLGGSTFGSYMLTAYRTCPTETITYTKDSLTPTKEEGWQPKELREHTLTRIDYIPTGTAEDGQEYFIKKTYDLTEYNTIEKEELFDIEIPYTEVETIFKEENIPTNEFFQEIIEIKQDFTQEEIKCPKERFALLLTGLLCESILIWGKICCKKWYATLKELKTKMKESKDIEETYKKLLERITDLEESIKNNEELYKKYKQLKEEITIIFGNKLEIEEASEYIKELEEIKKLALETKKNTNKK